MSQRSTRQNSTPVDSPSSILPDLRALLEESNKQVLRSINSLKEDIGNLRSTFSTLEKRIGGIEAALSSFQVKCEKEVNCIKNEIELLKSAQRKSNFEVLQEVEQRELRRNNIMIYGLSEESEGSLAERTKLDETLVEDIFKEIGANVPVEKIYRLGKINDSKCRPLKVKLPHQSFKGEIFRGAKELRNSSRFKNIYIRNDLTKLQQQEDFERRKELRRRRENGEDVIIRNGEIQLRNQPQNFQN